MKQYLIPISKEEVLEEIKTNGFLRLSLKEIPIAVTYFENTFYAFDDRCPHLGFFLSRGHINPQGQVVCPLHSYRYNLKNGEECMLRGKNLVFFSTIETETELFIQML
ncbi:MAG: Rieske (2Fe-2S) protein [Chitinophagaceae bacterium]|nr:Rieske (2Fe-2S) protein [Chitinophagaceae bacterium]